MIDPRATSRNQSHQVIPKAPYPGTVPPIPYNVLANQKVTGKGTERVQRRPIAYSTTDETFSNPQTRALQSERVPPPTISLKEFSDVSAFASKDEAMTSEDLQFNGTEKIRNSKIEAMMDYNIISSVTSLRNSRNIILDDLATYRPPSSTSLENKLRREGSFNDGVKNYIPCEQDDFLLQFKVPQGEFKDFIEFAKANYRYLFESSSFESPSNAVQKGSLSSVSSKTKERNPFSVRSNNQMKVQDFAFDLPVSLSFGSQLIRGRYSLGQKINEGTFGEIYSMTDMITGKKLVAKKVKGKNGSSDSDFFNQSLSEVAMLKKLLQTGNPEVDRFVHLVDYFYYNGYLILVFELLEISLLEAIERRCPFKLSQVRVMVKDLLSCLSFLHRQSIIHGDLKPENILFSDLASGKAKLIDFGTSIYLWEQSDQPVQSLPYRAPEIFLKKVLNPKVDMWALGTTLYSMVTRRVLFGNSSEHHNIAKAMSVGKFYKICTEMCQQSPSFFREGLVVRQDLDGSLRVFIPRNEGPFDKALTKAKCPPILGDFIKKCLEFDPADRIGSQEALAHPFFS